MKISRSTRMRMSLFCILFMMLTSCYQQESPDLSMAREIPDQKLKTFANCHGGTLLDSWAYFAAAGPDFPMLSKLDYRPEASLYFRANLIELDKKIRVKEKLISDKELEWHLGDELKEIYLEILPVTYNAMCMKQTEVLRSQIKTLSSWKKNDDKDKRSSFYRHLVVWEIDFALALTADDHEQLKHLYDKVSRYNLFDADLSFAETNTPLNDIEHLRYAAYK